MRPGGRIIGRIDGSQLRDQALPQDCRLFGRENGRCRMHGGLAAIPRRPLGCRSVAVRLAAMIGSERLLDRCFGYGAEIRRIEIILPGNPDQREQGIPPGIGERRAHPMRRGRIADRAHRPFRRHPFAGGMGEHGRQSNEAGVLIDRRGLHGRDLVPAQALADDVEPARKRCIAEGPVALSREGGPDGRDQGFLRIGELRLRLGQRRRNGANRFTGPVHGCPPCSGHRSSPRRIWSAWLGCHARSPPWRPPA